jgi:hypothetical protein
MPKVSLESKKPDNNLLNFDFKDSRVMDRNFCIRKFRFKDKNIRQFEVNFNKMTSDQIENELQRGIDNGLDFDKINQVKGDYQVWSLIQDRIRSMAMVSIANDTQEVARQSDGSLLSETDLAQIDYQLAKCENVELIATRFGVTKELIELRNLQQQQNIIDLRRRLNEELENSAIGLAHDFVRLEELQETLEIVKAHISQYEDARKRTDLTAEERLEKMAGIPNIISLITLKEKIIQGAQKEMKSRKESQSTAVVEFDLTASEQKTFEEMHQKLPIMELVVARASVDNGWDVAYMTSKLNKSIYRKFRRGFHGEDVEIERTKDMDLPYPSNQPVDLDHVVKNTEARDRDMRQMVDRDKDIDKEVLNEAEEKKRKLLEIIKKKRQDGNDSQDKPS